MGEPRETHPEFQVDLVDPHLSWREAAPLPVKMRENSRSPRQGLVLSARTHLALLNFA